MNNTMYLTNENMFALLFFFTSMQQQVIQLQDQVIEIQNRRMNSEGGLSEIIQLQQEVIKLQSRIEKMTPSNPIDEEVHWHLASNGMLSDEAANSDDIVVVERFLEWNLAFAEKHIKPFVSPKVFSECVQQMTRGLTQRIAKLETEEQMNRFSVHAKTRARKKTTESTTKPKQLALTQ